MGGFDGSDVGSESTHLTLQNVESAVDFGKTTVSGGYEIREGQRQREQLARQQPRTQRFQPLRMLIEHADQVLYRRDLKRLHLPASRPC